MPNHTRPVLVTAIHLLGPAGGLDRDIPAAEVPRAVTKLSLVECFGSSDQISFNVGVIPIPEAAPLGSASKAGDVVAFWMPDRAKVRPARLARATPEAGARVWLAASLVEGTPASQRLHGGTVQGLDEEGNLVYQFDNPALSIRATSGAPVLDARGDVVAINLGGYKAGNVMLGVGNPVGRFGPQLERAAAGGPKP